MEHLLQARSPSRKGSRPPDEVEQTKSERDSLANLLMNNYPYYRVYDHFMKVIKVDLHQNNEAEW